MIISSHRPAGWQEKHRECGSGARDVVCVDATGIDCGCSSDESCANSGNTFVSGFFKIEPRKILWCDCVFLVIKGIC